MTPLETLRCDLTSTSALWRQAVMAEDHVKGGACMNRINSLLDRWLAIENRPRPTRASVS